MRTILQYFLPGFWGLFCKEIARFSSVSIQTIFGPVLASLLFLFVFSHVLEGRTGNFHGFSYATFLVPSLAGMTMLQQSFANASSSLIVSKMMGNIVMILLTPISTLSFYLAYVLSAFVRGLIVASLLLLFGSLFAPVSIANPGWVIAFMLLGCMMTSAMGVVAGIYAEKFDEIALFQVVILMPLTFLSGVFYSIKSLPPLWQYLSALNPFTYFINGFRHGFLGVSDYPIWTSFLVTLIFTLAASGLAYQMLRTGYKLRN